MTTTAIEKKRNCLLHNIYIHIYIYTTATDKRVFIENTKRRCFSVSLFLCFPARSSFSVSVRFLSDRDGQQGRSYKKREIDNRVKLCRLEACPWRCDEHCDSLSHIHKGAIPFFHIFCLI